MGVLVTFTRFLIRRRFRTIHADEKHFNLLFARLAQTPNGGSDGECRCSIQGIRSSCNDFSTRFALPYSHCLTSHGILAAEVAQVLGMLADLDLLDLLAQRSTIPRAILSHDAHFLRAFCLRVKGSSQRSSVESSTKCISCKRACRASELQKNPCRRRRRWNPIFVLAHVRRSQKPSFGKHGINSFRFSPRLEERFVKNTHHLSSSWLRSSTTGCVVRCTDRL